MNCVVRIVGTAIGIETPHDGRWLVSYDHTHPDPVACIVSSDSIEDAMRFKDMGEFHAFYTQAQGVRDDGKPNRPLTAYTLEVMRA